MDSNVDFGADDAAEKASFGQGAGSRSALKGGAVSLILRILAVHAAAGVDLDASCSRIEAHLADGEGKWIEAARSFVAEIAASKDGVTLLDIARRHNAALSVIQEAMLTVAIGELRDAALRAAALGVVISEFPIVQDDLR